MRAYPHGLNGFTRDVHGKAVRVIARQGKWFFVEDQTVAPDRVFSTEAEAIAGKKKRAPKKMRVNGKTHAARTAGDE